MGDKRKITIDAPLFAEEMRAKGIHVGLGQKPYCVICDEPWPCRVEAKARTDAEA